MPQIQPVNRTAGLPGHPTQFAPAKLEDFAGAALVAETLDATAVVTTGQNESGTSRWAIATFGDQGTASLDGAGDDDGQDNPDDIDCVANEHDWVAGQDEVSCSECGEGMVVESAAVTTPGPRVFATIQLQKTIASGGDFVDFGRPIDFDITDIVAGMTADEIEEFEDGMEPADALFHAANAAGVIRGWDDCFNVTALDAINDYKAITAVADHVDEFLNGGPADLTAATARTIARLDGGFMPVKPQVSVNGKDETMLIYMTEDDKFNGTATRLTIDGDGILVSAGDGVDWEDDNPDNDRLYTLTELGFADRW